MGRGRAHSHVTVVGRRPPFLAAGVRRRGAVSRRHAVPRWPAGELDVQRARLATLRRSVLPRSVANRRRLGNHFENTPPLTFSTLPCLTRRQTRWALSEAHTPALSETTLTWPVRISRPSSY